MASIPFTNTIGSVSADLASKLFNTINRRNELKSQGKLAELQANLDRERRNFAAETQRLRDKDYQKFQRENREDQQAFSKQERIADQQYRTVQAELDRKFAVQQQQNAARYQMLHSLYTMRLNEYATDKERLRLEGKEKAAKDALYALHNELAQATGNKIEDKTFFMKNLEKVELGKPATWARLAPAWMGFQWAKDVLKGRPVAAGQQQLSGDPAAYQVAAQYGQDPLDLIQQYKETAKQGVLPTNPLFRQWVQPGSAEHKIGQMYELQGQPINRINRELQDLVGTGTGNINQPALIPVNPAIPRTMQQPGMGGFSSLGGQTMPFSQGMSLMDIMNEWNSQIGVRR